eukprot:m.34156 g.34156  ORF g.34156 m.34156 type:complete len:430 (+) comp7288_c0_seq1:89-1378(+)
MAQPSEAELGLLAFCDADRFWEAPYHQVAQRSSARRSEGGHAAKSVGRVSELKRQGGYESRSAPGGTRRSNPKRGGGAQRAPSQADSHKFTQHVDTYRFIEEYRGLYSTSLVQQEPAPRPTSSPVSGSPSDLLKVRGGRGRLTSSEKWAEEMAVRITGKPATQSDNVFSSSQPIRGKPVQPVRSRTMGNQPFVVSGSSFGDDAASGGSPSTSSPTRRGSRDSYHFGGRVSRNSGNARGSGAKETRAVGNTGFGPRFGRPLTARKRHSVKPARQSDEQQTRVLAADALFKTPFGATGRKSEEAEVMTISRGSARAGARASARASVQSRRSSGGRPPSANFAISASRLSTPQRSGAEVGLVESAGPEPPPAKKPHGKIVKQGYLSPHAQRRRQFSDAGNVLTKVKIDARAQPPPSGSPGRTSQLLLGTQRS